VQRHQQQGVLPVNGIQGGCQGAALRLEPLQAGEGTDLRGQRGEAFRWRGLLLLECVVRYILHWYVASERALIDQGWAGGAKAATAL